jgi:hypothetical protein
MTTWRQREKFVRGSVWRVPFQYEHAERVLQPAGGKGRALPGAYVDYGMHKDKCWMIILSVASDWTYMRVVCCKSAPTEQRLLQRIKDDRTKVLFEKDVHAGGWYNDTVADCANVRTIGNLAFSKGLCDYCDRIDETMMKEVDYAVARGLGLGSYPG